jgi:hypothetical protein
LAYWTEGKFQITIIKVSGVRFSAAGGSGKQSQELKPETLYLVLGVWDLINCTTPALRA